MIFQHTAHDATFDVEKKNDVSESERECEKYHHQNVRLREYALYECEMLFWALAQSTI